MSLVTFFWSLSAAIVLVLAALCWSAWLFDRRGVAKPLFCGAAIATAVATPLELGMMQVVTAAELGEQLRWYHVSIFFSLLGQVLFVRYYLGKGRWWLLWTFMAMRMFVLLQNLLLHPNLDFHELASLRYVMFLGEQIAVAAGSVPRTWHQVELVSLLLYLTFVVDATVQAWREGGVVLRRRILTVGLAILVPTVGNVAMHELVVSGVLHVPICATLWFMGALTGVGYELGREVLVNSRARVQVVEVRSESPPVERVNSLGQRAAALAHELAQPLAATQMNVETARMYLLGPSPNLDELRAILDDVYKDSLRAGEIIDRLRAANRERFLAARTIDVDQPASDA